MSSLTGRKKSLDGARDEAKIVRQWFLLSQKPRPLFPRFHLLVTGHSLGSTQTRSYFYIQ